MKFSIDNRRNHNLARLDRARHMFPPEKDYASSSREYTLLVRVYVRPERILRRFFHSIVLVARRHRRVQYFTINNNYCGGGGVGGNHCSTAIYNETDRPYTYYRQRLTFFHFLVVVVYRKITNAFRGVLVSSSSSSCERLTVFDRF